MKFCNRAEASSPSFSLIMLRCGGLECPWLRDVDRDMFVSRVVDYSSLVKHGRIPLYWEK